MMPSGYFPVLIGFRAVLVAVRIGVTVPESMLATQTVLLSGLTPMAYGERPTRICGSAVPVVVRIGSPSASWR